MLIGELPEISRNIDLSNMLKQTQKNYWLIGDYLKISLLYTRLFSTLYSQEAVHLSQSFFNQPGANKLSSMIV